MNPDSLISNGIRGFVGGTMIGTGIAVVFSLLRLGYAFDVMMVCMAVGSMVGLAVGIMED